MAPWQNPRFDRLWRLAALFVLCGLVYYFSFDNGRQTAKARIARYEEERVRMQSEISSLREQLKLRSAEIKDLKDQATPPDSPSDSSDLAMATVGSVEPRRPDLTIPVTPILDPENQEPESVTRLSLRSEESKLILDDQVRLSVLEIDSLDKVAQVRIQHLDTENRHTRTLEVGESIIVMRGSKRFILVLDQLKGSTALFILIES
jgi:hypothetical protein